MPTNHSSYTAVEVCPECSFEGGHSPTCTTRPAQIYRAVSELLSKVYGWHANENDVGIYKEIIRDLQTIKNLL